ncbi:MAG: hypothetical protein HQ472_05595 [Ignavibacteria bacterium]|nr:hypothetical protein [Ignavibacteria bacterium]
MASLWTLRSSATYVQNSLSLGIAVIHSIQLGGSYKFARGLFEPDVSTPKR